MPWTSMLGLGLLTDNLDVKLFDFDFIFFLDIDQKPVSTMIKTFNRQRWALSSGCPLNQFGTRMKYAAY